MLIAWGASDYDKTNVELFVDSAVTDNIHELEAKGAFGQFSVKVGGKRISETSPSSRIVPGSLAQAALGAIYARLPAE